jgi:transposase
VSLCDPQRFADGKAVASYIGMIPSEHSSGRRRRLGNSASKATPCCGFSREKRRCKRCAVIPNYFASIAESWHKKEWEKHAAAARKLGIRLWIMLRDQID